MPRGRQLRALTFTPATTLRVVTMTLKSLSDQRSECIAEIEYLEGMLTDMKNEPRPNPISVLRIQGVLESNRRTLAEIDAQEQL